MFACAWCKKEEISPATWSDFKEPICGECEYKYKIARERGMFVGKVSDLSKEQRHTISRCLNKLERFVRVMRSVDKVRLTGRFKLVAVSTGWTFVLMFLSPIVVFNDWFEYEAGILRIAYIIFVPISLYYLFNRTNWLLKLSQLKKEAEKLGYTI